MYSNAEMSKTSREVDHYKTTITKSGILANKRSYIAVRTVVAIPNMPSYVSLKETTIHDPLDPSAHYVKFSEKIDAFSNDSSSVRKFRKTLGGKERNIVKLHPKNVRKPKDTTAKEKGPVGRPAVDKRPVVKSSSVTLIIYDCDLISDPTISEDYLALVQKIGRARQK